MICYMERLANFTIHLTCRWYLISPEFKRVKFRDKPSNSVVQFRSHLFVLLSFSNLPRWKGRQLHCFNRRNCINISWRFTIIWFCFVSPIVSPIFLHDFLHDFSTVPNKFPKHDAREHLCDIVECHCSHTISKTISYAVFNTACKIHLFLHICLCSFSCKFSILVCLWLWTHTNNL